MPFRSDRQRRFFNANREKLEARGVDVEEYNRASKGMNLPETAPTKKHPKIMKKFDGHRGKNKQ